ncbi:MAG: hypothetical protein ACI39H_07190 [Lachnospiraceae bacterium]
MAEIKEFKKQTKEPTPAEGTTVSDSKKMDLQKLFDLLHHPKAPVVCIVVFAVLFLLDLYLMVHFTRTGITACCILLVIQTLLAVCLDKLSYAGLLGIAAIQIVVGIFSHNFLLSVLCMIPYFMALFVIHVQNLHGGIKAAS